MRSCFLVAALLLIVAPILKAEQDRQPNVIVVITDDQGYGDVGAHGNSMIQTPNLDKLHGRSVRLTDYHVDPTCSPSRSALLTGRYSTRTGVWHTIMGRSLMRGSEVTVAEMFRDAGYRTAMFGKWHLGDNYPLRPQDQGFEEAFYHGGGGVGQGPDYWGNDYFDDTYFRNGKPEKVDGYCTDVWFSDAMKFIERNKSKPFLVYLSTNAPHGPYLVDEKYSEPYVKKGVQGIMAKFYGMITNIDENMGRLVSKLDELKLTENTILIFTTDNGTAAGASRRGKGEPPKGAWLGFNSGMRGQKGSMYEGGHRVPFFLHWPAGGLIGGRDVDQLTAHVDLLPTLTNLAGVQRSKGPPIDGSDLTAILRGDKKALRDRTLLVHSQRIPYPEKWRQSSVMTEQWRLVNGKELYDIVADPGQTKDLATQKPKLVEKLRGSYEDWWTSLSKSFDKDVLIGLGSEAEPRSLLHSHDWRGKGGTPWHQNHVRKGFNADGYWAVDVTRGGEYEIVIRRWPEVESGPLEATDVKVRFGEQEQSVKVKDKTQEAATFRFRMKPGPTRLQAWLTLPSGETRGAYFAYVRRL